MQEENCLAFHYVYVCRSDIEYQQERKLGKKVEGVMINEKYRQAERERRESVCYTGTPVLSGDSGVERMTTTKAASFAKSTGLEK